MIPKQHANMILRQAVLRQGRRFVPPLRSRRTIIRAYATTLDTIEQSLANSLQETKSIEAQLQGGASEPIPTIEARQQFPFHLEHGQAPPNDDDPYDSKAMAVRQAEREAFQKSIGKMGSIAEKAYENNALVQLGKNHPHPKDVTLELLMASEAHLGHSTALWNPMNSRYIFGERLGIHIISLDITAAHLRRACRVAEGVAARGGLILFVGTRPGQDETVIKAARNAGGCHLFEKWRPGTITNRIEALSNAHMQLVDQYDRPLEGHEERMEQLAPLKPDLVICLDPMENYVLLRECGLANIPTIGIIDTNADPTWVTYAIPANDDSPRAAAVIGGALGMAAKDGKARRLKSAYEGKIIHRGIDLDKMGEEAEDLRAFKSKGEVEDREPEHFERAVQSWLVRKDI